MADVGNSNTPMGLRPVGTLGSAGYAGRVQIFSTSTSDTAAIGIGDAVAMTGTADANGVATVTRFTAAGTASILGACVGIKPDPTDLTKTYRAASSGTMIFVDTDPSTIYEIADSSTAQTTCLAATDVATNILLAPGTVDTTTGNSKTVLGTTVGTTTTMDCKVLGLSPKVGNAIGDYAKYQVIINRHVFSGFTAGQ